MVDTSKFAVGENLALVGERLPERGAPGRHASVRAVHERPHPGAHQPAEPREPGQLPRLGRARAEPQEFLEQIPIRRGRWWPDYVEWLHARSGELKPAPAKLGSRKHKAVAKAPGSYVHAN